MACFATDIVKVVRSYLTVWLLLSFVDGGGLVAKGCGVICGRHAVLSYTLPHSLSQLGGHMQRKRNVSSGAERELAHRQTGECTQTPQNRPKINVGQCRRRRQRQRFGRFGRSVDLRTHIEHISTVVRAGCRRGVGVLCRACWHVS